MVTLRGSALPASHGFDLLPQHRPLPGALPPKRPLPLRQHAARRTGWIFPATVMAEGIWSLFGSLVLGLGRRDHPLLIPQAPWIWLAGAVMISAVAAWRTWHAGPPE
jgi:hypothetical protein